MTPAAVSREIRRLADEYQELTGVTTYSGMQESPRLYLFSDGAIADPSSALVHMKELLARARYREGAGA